MKVFTNMCPIFRHLATRSTIAVASCAVLVRFVLHIWHTQKLRAPHLWPKCTNEDILKIWNKHVSKGNEEDGCHETEKKHCKSRTLNVNQWRLFNIINSDVNSTCSAVETNYKSCQTPDSLKPSGCLILFNRGNTILLAQHYDFGDPGRCQSWWYSIFTTPPGRSATQVPFAT